MDERSYALGVFDGEGCITAGFNKDGRTYLIVSVTMGSEDVVRVFACLWGGGVSRRSKPTTGGLTMWTWQITSSKAIPFLEWVAAYGLVKRDQALLALRLARSMEQYSWARRDGFSPFRGKRLLSDADRAERTQVINALRGLNGGRSRFTERVADPLATPVALPAAS